VTAALPRAAQRARPASGVLLAAVLSSACAGRTPGAAEPPPAPLDCASIRVETLRACVDGFRTGREGVLEDGLELRFALEAACPYAGAVAWSGCNRGAFQRFEGRSAAGRCGDEGDFVESSILTSCLRRSELPLGEWNRLVRECFRWAELGSARFRASCVAARAP
jgi:hypothetical protein